MRPRCSRLHERYARMHSTGRCGIVSRVAMTRAIELRTEVQNIRVRRDRLAVDAPDRVQRDLHLVEITPAPGALLDVVLEGAGLLVGQCALEKKAIVLTRVPGDTSTNITLGQPNPSAFGDQVLLAATVRPLTGLTGVPTGNVTFKDGATTLGSAPLLNIGGVATATFLISPAQLKVGTHPITAAYDGSDPFFTASTSVVSGSTQRNT